VLAFLGFFVVLARFMADQSALTALWAMAATTGLLGLLTLTHLPAGRAPLRTALAVPLRLAAAALPLALLLYLLFPRVGPLWSVPDDGASARTGLSGTLRLGGLADLAVDDSVALRVRFDGPAPPLSAMYFRGPVLGRFDGQDWTVWQAPALRDDEPAPRAAAQSLPRDLQVREPLLGYELVLEPGTLPVLPLLELTPGPLAISPPAAAPGWQQGGDLTWRRRRAPEGVVQVRAQATLVARHGLQAGAVALRDHVDLPPGRNPRTLALAAQMRQDPRFALADARVLAAQVLERIASGGYAYTLNPGAYGDDAVDEFWFDRRSGFCEHYAAAFVVLMRALDVPARIVTGYQGADPMPVDGWWIVRQRHAHAWAEVWQPGEGWLRVDPTAAVAPERVERSAALRPPPGLLLRTLGALDARWPEAYGRWREFLTGQWRHWVTGYGLRQQSELMKMLGMASAQPATLMQVLAGGCAALAAGALALLWWHRPRPAPWPAVQRDLAQRLNRLGVPARPHEGWRTLAERARAHLGPRAEPLVRELLALEQARYGTQADATPLPWRRWRRRLRRALTAAGRASAVALALVTAPHWGAGLGLGTGLGTGLGAGLSAGMGAGLGVGLVLWPGSAVASEAPSKRAPGGHAAEPTPPPSAERASPAPAAGTGASRSTPLPTAATRTADAARTAGLAADNPVQELAYTAREDVRAFATVVAQRHGMALDWVLAQLEPARRLPQVQRLIMPAPAGTARNWSAYRARFVEPRRIEAGLRFWQAHEKVLARAQSQWGVPAELIVGIIGVETLYGRHTGGFRTLDALATLAFDFPSGRRDRSAFFRDELEELLLIARREEVDVTSFVGSYAGAQGLPQFMPSSIRRWAVDFDGDGHVDLRANPVDAIGSVANYLAAFGWQAGMPTHYRVVPPREPEALARLLEPDILPSFTATEFAAQGAVLSRDGRQHQGPLALVALENGDDEATYVAGTRNFYVVTRYNWSSYYALAVIELGQAVARARRVATAQGR